MNEQKTCFVVQGFGKKTDFRTGRQLDLDASYEVIKEAVEKAGLQCIRADEIQHSQLIDKPMYEQILAADLVIADLSTSNLNAVYELGVRHALRKRPTIIVAEKQWDFPFDINRNLIRTYEHLGPDLGRREAKRFCDDLVKLIAAVLADESAVDSPLYTFLPELNPPAPIPSRELAETTRGFAMPQRTGRPQQDGAPVKVLMDQAKDAITRGDFENAKTLLAAARQIRPNDEYIIQRLVLATYKSKQPTEEAALRAAHDLMVEKLSPEQTNDPETIELWAAVHKRLWSQNNERAHLDASIDALQRGFLLRGDYYNGINLAYMLNERAALPNVDAAEAIADFVHARRARKRVLAICQEALDAGVEDDEEKYWLLATLWKAAEGLGDATAVTTWEKQTLEHASSTRLPDWMVESTKEQIDRLAGLLKQSPPLPR